MTTLVDFLKDETGATAAEYAMILAIVGGAVAAASLTLGNTIANAFNSAGNCMASPSSANC